GVEIPDVAATEQHGPAQCRLGSHERAQQRRLAGAVGSEEARQRPRVQVGVDVPKDGGARPPRAAVARVDAAGGEDGVAHVGTCAPSWRRRISTQSTTGAPMNAVMEFSGRAVLVTPFPPAMYSATSTIAAPSSAEAGSTTRWAEVFTSPRTRWGAARPTNPMAPQKAVTTPARTATLLSARNCTRRTRMPMVAA